MPDSDTTNFEFDSNAVAAWVELCLQEGEMIRNGVSQDSQEIKILRALISTKMVMLLPNLQEDEKTNLLLFLLRDGNECAKEKEVENSDPVEIK